MLALDTLKLTPGRRTILGISARYDAPGVPHPDFSVPPLHLVTRETERKRWSGCVRVHGTGQSVRLDPSLLELKDVLESWLQHFDGTKGTHVCLVDSSWSAPPSSRHEKASRWRSNPSGRHSVGGALERDPGPRGAGTGWDPIMDPLWRRLLLGEGDEDWVWFSGEREEADREGGDDVPGSPASDAGKGAGAARGGFRSAKVSG